MSELLNTYIDASFISALGDMAPAVGFGLILGIIVAVIGWVWGFVVRLGTLEI